MSKLIGMKFNVVDIKKDHERINSFQCVEGVWECVVKSKGQDDVKLDLEECLTHLISFKLPVAKDNIGIALELLKIGTLNDKGVVVAMGTTVEPEVIMDIAVEQKIKDKLPHAKIESIHIGKDFLVVTLNSKAQAKKLQKAKWVGKLGAQTKRDGKQVLILKQEV